jgi:hypothetical protein
MIKSQIPNQLLMDWFTKSLLPLIAKDFSMIGAASEEKTILHAHHLDLIFSQFGTLYNIILHALRYSTDPHRTNPIPHANGVVGSVSNAFVGQLVGKLSNTHISSNPPIVIPTT